LTNNKKPAICRAGFLFKDKKVAKTPEGLVKDKVKKLLEKHNVWNKMIVPSRFGSTVGMSDFLILHFGHFVVAETKPKTDLKGPTPKQTEFMDEVDLASGVSLVVRNDEDIVRLEQVLIYARNNPLTPCKVIRDVQA